MELLFDRISMLWELFWCHFGFIGLSGAPSGTNRHPDRQKEPQTQKVSRDLEVILESVWNPGSIKNRIVFLMLF